MSQTELLDCGREFLVVWTWYTVVGLVLWCPVSGSLELFHGFDWKLGHGVVFRTVVVNFVNGYRSVHDFLLDGLLVDDWLDHLVYVVVPMFANYCW